MKKHDIPEGHRSLFQVSYYANRGHNLLERIERLATGASYWCFRRWKEDKRLDDVMLRYGKQSFETKRQRDRCERAELGCRYSQPLDKTTEAKIAEERFAQVPDRDIRLLIASRIINPKMDGEYQVSMAKERCLLVVGWLFVFLCVTAFSLTAALVWASPAGLMLKVILTLALLAVLFLLAYAMSCYGIRPFFLVRRIE